MQLGQILNQPLKILIHSPSGRGKTACLTTLGKDLQLIDLDLGTETARRLQDPFSQERLLPDVLLCPEPTPTQSAIAFTEAKNKMILIANAITQKIWPYKVLGVDSLTTLVDAGIRYVLANNGRLNRAAVVPSKGNAGGNISQPEWGLVINEIENMVILLKSMQCHVVILAHSVAEKQDNGMTRMEISIPTQKLPPRIPNYFDEIWYMEHVEMGAGVTERVFRTVESATYLAKSRAGLPDKTKVSLGMRKIFSLLGREI
jgi:hypothetical protein